MSDCVITFTLTANQAAPTSANQWNGLGRSACPEIPRQDIHITGTWGSGTAKLVYSIDGGTTWIDVPADKEANIVSLSANGIMTVKQRWPLLGIVLSGATNPNLVIVVV